MQKAEWKYNLEYKRVPPPCTSCSERFDLQYTGARLPSRIA